MVEPTVINKPRRHRGVYVPARELERKCVEYQAQGLTYSEIGYKIGVKPSRVATAIRRAVDRSESLVEQEVVTLRTAQYNRLMGLYKTYCGAAYGTETQMIVDRRTGQVKEVSFKDKGAAKILLEIEKLIADLVGTFAPKKVDSTVTNTLAIDEELKGLFGGNTKVRIPVGIEDQRLLSPIIDVVSECDNDPAEV